MANIRESKVWMLLVLKRLYIFYIKQLGTEAEKQLQNQGPVQESSERVPVRALSSKLHIHIFALTSELIILTLFPLQLHILKTSSINLTFDPYALTCLYKNLGLAKKQLLISVLCLPWRRAGGWTLWGRRVNKQVTTFKCQINLNVETRVNNIIWKH